MSFTSTDHHPARLGSEEGALDHHDREYCDAIKGACLRAIANTSYAVSDPSDQTIPADSINIALIDVMGTIAGMVEETLPKDMHAWAEGVAHQFAASFHATRSSLTADELALLRGRQ
jgi:hypothetical protein